MVEKRKSKTDIIKKQIFSKALSVYWLEKERGSENLPLAFARKLTHILEYNRMNTKGVVKPDGGYGEGGWKGISYELLYAQNEELKGFLFNVKLPTYEILQVPFERGDFKEGDSDREVFECLLQGLEENIYSQNLE